MTDRLAMAVALVVAAACSREAPRAEAAAAAARPVALVAAGTAAMPTAIAVSGVLAPQEQLVVALEVGGRLLAVPVDVGDVVERGQKVAELGAREFELDVARARAAVAAAEARLGQGSGAAENLDVEAVPAVREATALLAEARLQRDRSAAMVQGEVQAQAQLDAAEAALAVAESRLQRARDDVRTWFADVRLRRIELQQAEKRLADAVAVAPWTGRVAERHAVAGQVVGPGAPVVTLLRVDPLRLQLRVPDRLAGGVAIGQRVEFSVDGVAGSTHEGQVARIGPRIDRGDRTRLVEAEVRNADGALLPGAFCRARIVTSPATPVVVVPRSAVLSFAGVDRVFTVDADGPGPTIAKGLLVELGRIAGDVIEVVRGLEAGTRIVRDAQGLSPGVPVVVE
jgi:RND family efflux transporter MFP subunit